MGELAPDTLVHGRYRIKRVISSGGMSSVYEAFDEDLERVVAIKQNGDMLPGVLFLREAKLLARLRHPHLPAAIDVFEENNQQFFVMEYIEGPDLDQLLSERKRFSVDEVRRWVPQILDALDYLHTREQPVIHRDIKPSNLILSNGMMFLVDFGISKDTVRTWLSGSGTRQYASPEHAAGPTTPESDLYSFSATVYHLLTGRPVPAADIRLNEVRIKGRNDPLVPAHVVEPEVGAAVGEVLGKGLSLDPEERYRTAAQMREAFELATVEPAVAAPTPADAKTGRLWWNRTQPVAADTQPPPAIGEPQRPARMAWALPLLLGVLLLFSCVALLLWRQGQQARASAATSARPSASGEAIVGAIGASDAAAASAAAAVASSGAAGSAGAIASSEPAVEATVDATPADASSTPTDEVVAPSEPPAESPQESPPPSEPVAPAQELPPSEPPPSEPTAEPTAELIAPTPAPALDLPAPLAPAAQNEIRIALQSPNTGEWGALGVGIKHGSELSILQQNRPLTDLGYRVEFVPYDDRGNPEQGKSNAQAIVADPAVRCVVGSFNSGVTLATQPVYAEDNLVQVSPGSTNPQVTDGNDNVWRVVGRDDVQGAVAARYAREALRTQRPYVIHDDTAYGRGIATFFRRDIEQNGLAVAGFRAYDDSQDEIDFNPILDEIQAANADVIYFAGAFSRAGVFFKQARERGIGAQFLGSDSLDNPQLAQLGGDAVNGMHFTTVAAPVSEFRQAAKFAQDYLAAFGEAAPPFSPEGYDATTVCIQAIARAAREQGRIPTRLEVLEAMRRFPAFRGISGNYRFNENGDPQSVGYFVVEVNAQNWAANRVVQALLAAPAN